MKFKCNNEKCERFGQVEELFKTTTVYGKNGAYCKQQPCPKCGEMREDVSKIIPLSEKEIGVLKIPSMTRAQKTAMLQKRSHEHFNKSGIKDSKNDKLGRAIREMRGGK